jgi:nucleoside-diphosphate-sugar epimerase
MRIFVAGASGALGRHLLPRLVERGHEVTGMARSPSKAALVGELGATPVVADALDRDQLVAAVVETSPQVIVHELTALSGSMRLRRFDRDFELTNRLRTEGTDNLLDAARAVGAKRFVAQSYTGWPYARVGGPVKSEDDPLDPDPVLGMRESFEAIRHLEDTVTGVSWTDGIVLRYGGFYGPGTSLWPGGEHLEAIRKRRFPVVGSGAGVWSFIRMEDAADATVAAIERASRGIYNVVDDSPERVSEWLPAMAEAIGAPAPRRVPRWLGRLLAGEAVTVMMTEMRGASNAKAKRELDWRPRYPSWREGLAESTRDDDAGASGIRAAKAAV